MSITHEHNTSSQCEYLISLSYTLEQSTTKQRILTHFKQFFFFFLLLIGVLLLLPDAEICGSSTGIDHLQHFAQALSPKSATEVILSIRSNPKIVIFRQKRVYYQVKEYKDNISPYFCYVKTSYFSIHKNIQIWSNLLLHTSVRVFAS